MDVFVNVIINFYQQKVMFYIFDKDYVLYFLKKSMVVLIYGLYINAAPQYAYNCLRLRYDCVIIIIVCKRYNSFADNNVITITGILNNNSV